MLAVIGDELISENRGIAFRHGRAFHIEKVHEEIWELEHVGRFCCVLPQEIRYRCVPLNIKKQP